MTTRVSWLSQAKELRSGSDVNGRDLLVVDQDPKSEDRDTYPDSQGRGAFQFTASRCCRLATVPRDPGRGR